MNNQQVEAAAAIYKTTGLHPESRGGDKYRADISRAIVAKDFTHYITMGGILGNSYDFHNLRKAFPRGI